MSGSLRPIPLLLLVAVAAGTARLLPVSVAQTDAGAAELGGLANDFTAAATAAAVDPAFVGGTLPSAAISPALAEAFAAVERAQLMLERALERVPAAAAGKGGQSVGVPTHIVAAHAELQRAEGVLADQQYGEALGAAYLFYEAQRSGQLPPTNRVPWRKSAHLGDLVPGGWYDAGDYIKHSLTTAQAALFLAWSALDFPAGLAAAGQGCYAVSEVVWAADYLTACHLAPYRYVGLIGDPDKDHDFWGRPQEQPTGGGRRPVFIWTHQTAAADLLGTVSAALASASLLTRQVYPEKSGLYLRTAGALYRWAVDRPGLFAKSYEGYPEWLYGTSYYNDKLMLAAGWLFRATGNSTYLYSAYRHWLAAGGRKGHRDTWGGEINPYISWDSMYAPAAVNLLRIAQQRRLTAMPGLRDYERFVSDVAEIWRRTGKWSLEHTPYGLRYARWSKWGNLRYAANAAFTMLLHSQTLPPDSRDRAVLIKFARSQVDYCMGSTGRSFIVGFGRNPPRREHHAAASCPDPPAPCGWKQFETSAPNPQVLTGALVGGPAGPVDDTYSDERDDFETNEVSIDYNAGLTAALAGLLALEPDCCAASLP